MILLILFLNFKYDKNQSGTPFPFMKLAAELRLKVYRYHLIQDSPIELWPHVKDNTMFNANRKRSNAFAWYIGLKYTLRFLRVSSTINEEASQVPCGANKFRFSGINGGWFYLRSYIQQDLTTTNSFNTLPSTCRSHASTTLRRLGHTTLRLSRSYVPCVRSNASTFGPVYFVPSRFPRIGPTIGASLIVS